MFSIQDLANYPNALSHDYQHAAVAQRIQLTGHIHQALPDVCEQAYKEHWDCLNKHGEERWDEVFARADQVRAGFAQMIDSAAENIALATNLHELFVRFLSILSLSPEHKILTTDAEHPSVARQLARLNEEGLVQVVSVPADPASDVVERLSAAIDEKTIAVCVSSVNFITGHQTLELDTLMPLCQKVGAELFVDAYLSVNVQHFSVEEYNLKQAFVAAGGAKYCQMGNGTCFMHVPPARDFRPLVTGWFGCFDPMLDSPASLPVAYSDDATRFNGSTYDAMPHFRALHVFEFFRQKGLDVDFLADVNHRQLTLLAKRFKALEVAEDLIHLPVDVEYMGGFMALKTPHAQALCEKMRDRGVHTDYRQQWLRLGPAPYLCDEQLEDGIIALEEALQEVLREA